MGLRCKGRLVKEGKAMNSTIRLMVVLCGALVCGAGAAGSHGVSHGNAGIATTMSRI